MSIATLPPELLVNVCELAGARASCNLSATSTQIRDLFQPKAWIEAKLHHLHIRIANSFVGHIFDIANYIKELDESVDLHQLSPNEGCMYHLIVRMLKNTCGHLSETFHSIDYAVAQSPETPVKFILSHTSVHEVISLASTVRFCGFSQFLDHHSSIRVQTLPRLREVARVLWHELDEELDRKNNALNVELKMFNFKNPIVVPSPEQPQP